jgi:hypothetical protein
MWNVRKYFPVEDAVTVVFTQTAPYPERFASLKGAFPADSENFAFRAELLGRLRPPAASESPLSFRVEEEVRVSLTARAGILPFPVFERRNDW